MNPLKSQLVVFMCLMFITSIVTSTYIVWCGYRTSILLPVVLAPSDDRNNTTRTDMEVLSTPTPTRQIAVNFSSPPTGIYNDSGIVNSSSPPTPLTPVPHNNMTYHISAFDTLEELRESVSKVFNLKASLAVYKDHVKPENMELRQIELIDAALSNDTLWKNFSDTFYTIQEQKTCAIVGSSGILLGGRCGNEIDAHDFVMRMNMPTTKGFEKDVGAKTNLTSVNKWLLGGLYNALKQNPKSSRYKTAMGSLNGMKGMIMWSPANFTRWKSTRRDLQAILNNAGVKRVFKYEVGYSLHPIWPFGINRFWNTTDSSSGMIVFTIATLFCKSIDLYGFWPFAEDNTGKFVRHHYYTPESKYNYRKSHQALPHDFEILQGLSKKGLIKMVTEKCS